MKNKQSFKFDEEVFFKTLAKKNITQYLLDRPHMLKSYATDRLFEYALAKGFGFKDKKNKNYIVFNPFTSIVPGFKKKGYVHSSCTSWNISELVPVLFYGQFNKWRLVFIFYHIISFLNNLLIIHSFNSDT